MILSRLLSSVFLGSLVALAASVACRAGRVEAASPDVSPPTLSGESLEHWAAVLEPAAEDRAWLDIPWHASFHDGLAAADEADRPLMLWLMNGHPLGCT